MDIYYFWFGSKTLIKPENNYKFENKGKDIEDFLCIIIDIYNEKGENFYQLLLNKGKKESKMKLTKDEIEKPKPEKKGIEKGEKEKLYEEYEKLMKEQEKIMILEEKEKKRQENEEKERLNKLKKQQELERQKEREKFICPPYGINNYGNTSYFNSINQIFFNLPILQQIFLDPKIDYYINKRNKYGHQGKFFEIYKKFY